MFHIMNSCYKKGSAIRFLKDELRAEGTTGKMVIQIITAVAEAEREPPPHVHQQWAADCYGRNANV